MINMVKKENQPANALSVHLKTRKHAAPQSENMMIMTLIHLKVILAYLGGHQIQIYVSPCSIQKE